MRDGDSVSVARLGSEPAAPTVLLLHGLEGTLRSNYLGGQAQRYVGRGWNVAVLLFRTCDGRLGRAPRLYHSGETTDLAAVAERLLAESSGPLAITGVSLGANVLVKWLGERGASLPERVRGGVAISPPFDLTRSGPALDRALGGFYSRRFLKTLSPKALARAAAGDLPLDAERVARCRTIEEFDDVVTAPLHGFEGASDYWRRCGCGQFLPGVDRPLLLLAARDDPFNPGDSIPVEEVRRHPSLFGSFPERGGHVGFVGGWPHRTRHWAEETAEAFLATLFARRAL